MDPRRAAAVALALAATSVLVACGDEDEVPGGYVGIVRESPSVVGDLSLPDASLGGDRLPLRADPGEVLVVYFGYTACPDVCPTSMSDLRTALRQLRDDADRVEVAMVSVDPDRDTPQVLSRYIDSFVDGGHALRTDDGAELRRVAGAFGATYSLTTSPGGEVQVSHTAFLYAVDEAGVVRVTWPFATPPADLAADLTRLLGELDRSSDSRR